MFESASVKRPANKQTLLLTEVNKQPLGQRVETKRYCEIPTCKASNSRIILTYQCKIQVVLTLTLNITFYLNILRC